MSAVHERGARRSARCMSAVRGAVRGATAERGARRGAPRMWVTHVDGSEYLSRAHCLYRHREISTFVVTM